MRLNVGVWLLGADDNGKQNPFIGEDFHGIYAGNIRRC